jgi:hypothetical protein
MKWLSALLAAVSLSCCLGTSAQIIGPGVNVLSLDIEVYPNGTFDHDAIADSRLLTLKFAYHRSGIQGTGATYVLRSLEYSVFNESESVPFFSDKLSLTSNVLPNTITVSPGIYVPSDSTRIRVQARLAYTVGVDKVAEAQTEAAVVSPMIAQFDWIERIYDRMRDGYIRRHILDSGRGLSQVWLKEYEPGVDDRELLRHSRTEKVAGRTRVYVPWVDRCTDKPVLLGSTLACGASVQDNSSIVYGGDENPLLRTGLGVATFALEYLAYQRDDSLRHAIKLFEYIEQSEWKEPGTGQPTGFFVRSRWPGNLKEIDDQVYRQYWFASTDELSGISLGMGYLYKALGIAYVNHMHGEPGLAPSEIAAAANRVASLADRLGNQLRNNFYFVLPLKKVGDAWVSIGLPRERHIGWAGTYPFEWFLARGFKSITGNDYSPTADAYAHLSNFILAMNGLEVRVDAGDPLLYLGVELGERVVKSVSDRISPHTRALLSIQTTGIGMRYRGQDFSVPIPCAPDKSIHIPDEFMPRYNYAMLLHVYQFAMLGDPWPAGDAYVIKREMARLVKGVLNGGEATQLYMPEFVKDVYFGALSVMLTGFPLPFADEIACSTVCNCSPTVQVGSRWEPYNVLDTYSAAVAIGYRLPAVYSDTAKRDEYWSRINNAFANYPYVWNLPTAERTYASTGSGALYGLNITAHNPAQLWSKSFGWEHFSPHVLGGGNEPDAGLSNVKIALKNVQNPSVDAMVEGSGLDVLLPWSLNFALNPDLQANPLNRDFMKLALNTHAPPYMRACSTNAVTLGLASLGFTSSPNFKKCAFAYLTPTYAIAATASPIAGGTVTCTPNPVNHGGTATCTASANAGYAFSGYSGDCNGSTCTFQNVTATRNVVATFVPSVPPLTVAKRGTGIGRVVSTPAGIDCGSTCSASFALGTPVTLAATTPWPGSAFGGWTGACAGAGACAVAMSAARSVTATFVYTGSAYSYDYVAKAFVAYYGRPADPGGQAYWAGRMDAEGRSLNAIIAAFGSSAEFNRRYGGLTNAALITRIYQQTLARDPDPAGLAWYVGELQAGRRTLQTITLDVLNGATTAPDSTTVANKLDVAAYYTAKVAAGCPYGSEQDGVSALSGVTASAATVAAAKAAINSRCGL